MFSAVAYADGADSGDDDEHGGEGGGDAATVILAPCGVAPSAGKAVLLRQRVSFETVEGLCARRECKIYQSDSLAAIEARLCRLGASALPSMRVTAVSIQFYDRERKEIVEVRLYGGVRRRVSAG